MDLTEVSKGFSIREKAFLLSLCFGKVSRMIVWRLIPSCWCGGLSFAIYFGAQQVIARKRKLFVLRVCKNEIDLNFFEDCFFNPIARKKYWFSQQNCCHANRQNGQRTTQRDKIDFVMTTHGSIWARASCVHLHQQQKRNKIKKAANKNRVGKHGNV